MERKQFLSEISDDEFYNLQCVKNTVDYLINNDFFIRGIKILGLNKDKSYRLYYNGEKHHCLKINYKCPFCDKILTNDVLRLKNRGFQKSCTCIQNTSKHHKENYLGARIGNSVVVEYVGPKRLYKYSKGRKKGKYSICHYYKLLCDCGKYFEEDVVRLRNSTDTSCGCLAKNHLHMLTNEQYYNVFRSFNRRCCEVSNKDFYKYGARGIYVVDEWKYYPNEPNLNRLNRTNYFNFESWYNDELKKLNLTYEESKKLNYTIDRIDNDGPYAPWNCRLATQSQQYENRRDNVKYQLRNVFLQTLGKTIKDLVFTQYGNYIPCNTITIRDRLDKEQIIKGPNGKKYIKPRRLK